MGSKPEVEWSWTDTVWCGHNSDKPCPECEEREELCMGVMLVFLTAGDPEGDYPGDSPWENPGDGVPYCMPVLPYDTEPQSWLEGQGFDATEGA